ncbi:MAG: prepilin-type N-terminal cleavage/methylation domain-containing protein [Cephaloticoccus sp.]|nr:prepilin-type N-terminal cleavage/methylation domain-containing protein [Cephaloticoccus sp.]MCF7760067.1 prepilin-type N-terminal cleavage/methylation domain-containing protein [Cephaloticoccus sp.]
MPSSIKSQRGFTIVELIIGATLSLMIMGVVLSSYVFLARHFVRSIGISTAAEPTLEVQARRTLQYFTQDVAMASAITAPTTPVSATLSNKVTLTIPNTSGTTTVTYYYDSSAQTLTRQVTGQSARTLHRRLLTCVFTYYDASGNPYSSFSGYTKGIKQISLSFTAQTGNASNGTMTPVYVNASPRLLLRNLPNLQ